MSETYTCYVKKDIWVIQRAYNEIEYSISLLDVLDPEEMEEEFREVLYDLGAEPDEDGKVVMKVDDAEVTVDPGKRMAKIWIDEEGGIEVSIDAEMEDHEEDSQIAQKKAEEKTEKDIKLEIEQKKKTLEEETRKRLQTVEERVKEKLREAANETNKPKKCR